MTGRRFQAKPSKSPTLTGGDDQPAVPCVNDLEGRRTVRQETGIYPPSPFDRLIAPRAGDMPAFAAVEAAQMCGPCPIRDTCLLGKNRDEEWAQTVVGVLTRWAEAEGAA